MAIYLLANSPFMLFHYHQTDPIFTCGQTEEADFGKFTATLGDKAQMSKTPKKCLLCDHESISVHKITSFEFQTIRMEPDSKIFYYHKTLLPAYHFYGLNKDPPSVV